MFPVLETERLILKPFEYEDYEKVFELIIACKKQGAKYDYSKINTLDDAKALTDKTVEANNEFLILDKKTESPVGFAVCDHALSYKNAKRIYITHHIRDEYRHIGLGHEILLKLMNFAFCGINAENVVTNVREDNTKAVSLMESLSYYQYDFFPKKKPAGGIITLQFIISKQDYDKQEYAYKYTYDYQPPKPVKSPYSYEKPIRKIDGIEYIKQPTGYLCGQSVVAMLAGVKVDDVIGVMQNEKGTTVPEVRGALKYYGIQTATKARMRYTEQSVLPECSILSVKLPRYGHWSLYYKGLFYDPEFGIVSELPKQAELCYFWEVVCR